MGESSARRTFGPSKARRSDLGRVSGTASASAAAPTKARLAERRYGRGSSLGSRPDRLTPTPKPRLTREKSTAMAPERPVASSRWRSASIADAAKKKNPTTHPERYLHPTSRAAVAAGGKGSDDVAAPAAVAAAAEAVAVAVVAATVGVAAEERPKRGSSAPDVQVPTVAKAAATKSMVQMTTGLRPRESTSAPTTGDTAISVTAPALEAAASHFVAASLP